MREWWDDLDFPRIRNLFRYFRRALAWLSFLWREGIEEWDHGYLYRTMAFAIRRQANCIEQDALYIGFEKDVRHMRICATCLERMASDAYGDAELERIASDYGWDGFPGISFFDRKEKPQERRRLNRLHKFEALMKKADMDMFCQIFSKHSQKWWD